MNMKKDIYDDASLIKKSLLKDLSEEDRMKLEQLLEDRQLGEVYDQLSDPTYLKKQFMEYENYSGKKGYMVFRERRGRARRVNMIRWVAAVAAVWVIVLGSMLWLTLGESGEKEVPPVASKVIPAGEKKARLILADGTEVEVSKTGAHVLKEEGVNIKYENGEISYETERVSTEIVYNELEVPRGGECIITLDDGTKVWVNAATEIYYPVKFVGKERRVWLEGEAYFEVTKDAAKPFIVEVNGMEIKVYGTQFNVNTRRDDQMQTTLVEGSVSVKPKGLAEVRLKPNQQAVFNKLVGRVTVREVDVLSYVAWQRGNYYFENKSIGEILDELSLWYDIQVFFMNNEVSNERFSGYLPRYEEIDELLSLIEKTSHVRFEIKGRVIVVRK